MKRKSKSLSEQVKRHSKSTPEKEPTYTGNQEIMVSTGSTLGDLAISGGRKKEGGIPTGILVEVFGPSGGGKTVLLSEIAGGVQRKGGDVLFLDPEARYNENFGKTMGFDIEGENTHYKRPQTVRDMFTEVENFDPKNKELSVICGDSLAALTTDWELEGKDQYGMRRAKEFSEGFRKICRKLSDRNTLLICSNQIRQNSDAGLFGEKFKSPGGEAIGFYSSLRLKTKGGSKKKEEVSLKGKKYTRITHLETGIYVYKSSVWKPYRDAPIYIEFDYGIDDIRANLRFVKQFTGASTYTLDGDEKLGQSIQQAIEKVEEDSLEGKLKKNVIKFWQEIENKFAKTRKPKRRL